MTASPSKAVVDLNEKISRRYMSYEVTPKKTFLCYAGMIESFGEFYAIPAENWPALEVLMDRLQKIMNDPGHYINNNFPKVEDLKEGSCIALQRKLLDFKWHRAQIIRKCEEPLDNEEQRYDVQYVDFGDRDSVYLSQIRYLAKELDFDYLKAQAIPCVPAIGEIYSRDRNFRWTSEETLLFRDSVFDKPLALYIRGLAAMTECQPAWEVNIHLLSRIRQEKPPHYDRDIDFLEREILKQREICFLSEAEIYEKAPDVKSAWSFKHNKMFSELL